jgi:hypothetical protein
MSRVIEQGAGGSMFARQTITAGTGTAESDQSLSLIKIAKTYARAALGLLETADFLEDVSAATGGMVKIDPHYGSIPYLLGDDNRPVLLYDFVATLDGISDYAQIKKAHPTLSYAQISSAMSFLRKVSQFNTRQLDIDAMEDADEEDEDFQRALIESVKDQEVVRVLSGE